MVTVKTLMEELGLSKQGVLNRIRTRLPEKRILRCAQTLLTDDEADAIRRPSTLKGVGAFATFRGERVIYSRELARRLRHGHGSLRHVVRSLRSSGVVLEKIILKGGVYHTRKNVVPILGRLRESRRMGEELRNFMRTLTIDELFRE